MTDSVPTNNILQTYRAFPPLNPDTNCDQGYTGYSNVQGTIVNNIVSNNILGPDTNCQVVLQLPKWTESSDSYDQATCEDKYYGWTGATGPQCELGDTGCAPIYKLQSLQLVTKNLVNGSVTAVPPSSLQPPGGVFGDYLQQSPLNENCVNNCTYEAAFTCGYTGSSNLKNTVNPFIYDGLLAPVYNIGYASRCSLYNNIESIKYFITPFQNATDNTVKGTQYFTIGNGKNPCTCVALLNFGNIFNATDEEINANLYWVNVKLYTKNKYGNVCIKRPVSLHIEHGADNGTNNCFTPYFAHSREIPLESNKSDEECWTPTYQCGSGGPSEQPVSKCLHMVFVSDCVDIAQLGLISDDNCNYCTSLILIPKPNLLC